jgi:hypothetical protein
MEGGREGGRKREREREREREFFNDNLLVKIQFVHNASST